MLHVNAGSVLPTRDVENGIRNNEYRISNLEYRSEKNGGKKYRMRCSSIG
jgi:hypothetical protein